MRGLTGEEAGRRLAKHGPNVLPDADRPRPLRELAAQFAHTLAILLWVAAGLALLAGPSPLGWSLALACPLVLVDGIAKHVSTRSRAAEPG